VGHQINHGGVETIAPTSTSFAEVVGNEFSNFQGVGVQLRQLLPP
jgi:hypothetical protein